MRSQSILTLIAAVIFTIALCAASPARAACPSGSQFFAYGGAGGCVKPGSSEVVVRCFSMGKVCPTGWSNEGPTDSGSWCCPPVASKGTPRGNPNAPKREETCTWRGTAPFCKGRCLPGEAGRRRARDSEGTYAQSGVRRRCLTGLQSLLLQA